MSSLEAQAAERKARLAALRNKNKSQTSVDNPKEPAIKSRNYDPTTQSTILGSSRPPTTLDENSETVEAVSQAVSDEILAKFRAQADVSVKEAIKPRKATWDLERDLADDLRLLQEKTDEVIHSIVKERIHKLKGQDS
jgi:coiled-coil domain-containing protein 12